MSAPSLIVAHRGAWGPSAAENSLEAFEHAISIGADMIEFDVRRTRDGRLIVHHDPIDSLPYEELRATGTDARPPLLEDVLDLARGRIALDVELKEPGYVGAVVELLNAFGAEHCVVTSFLGEVVGEVGARAPELRTGLLLGPGQHATRDRYPATDYLALHESLADPATLAAAAPCLLWTVNDVDAIERYLADPAVAGVITDVPALALERRARMEST
jgi:glycerophosphoryl diester phosphodiesterase